MPTPSFVTFIQQMPADASGTLFCQVDAHLSNSALGRNFLPLSVLDIDLAPSRLKVDVLGAMELGALENLPAYEKGKEDRNIQIICQEACHAPVPVNKYGISAAKPDDDKESEADPS